MARELLLGNITNTNARDISRALSAVGVNVFWHTVVGDNRSGSGPRWTLPAIGRTSSLPPAVWAHL